MFLTTIKPEQVKWVKAAVFVICLVPLALLLWHGSWVVSFRVRACIGTRNRRQVLECGG